MRSREETVMGGTGYQPVPRGNLPRGMAERPRLIPTHQSVCCRAVIPSGQWPDGTGW